MWLPLSDITLPIEPFISAGGVVIVAVIGGCFTLAGIWMRGWMARLERQTAPTGNGYAGRTESTLARIERQGERTARQLDELTQRFNAHIDFERQRSA